MMPKKWEQDQHKRYYKTAGKDILYIGLFAIGNQDKLLEGKINKTDKALNVGDWWAMELKPGFKDFAEFEKRLFSTYPRKEIALLPIKFWEELPLLKSFDEFIKLIRSELPLSRLYRQSRSMAKTSASIVGRNTSGQMDLFSKPEYIDDKLELYRRAISQTAQYVAHILIAQWQAHKNADGFYRITNLSEFARFCGIGKKELKYYLLSLGAFQYPLRRIDRINKEIAFGFGKMFDVWFRFHLKNSEKEDGFNDGDKVGTKFAYYLKNRDVKAVDVRPHQLFIDEIDGTKELLNYFYTDDRFLADSKDLSQMGFKILWFAHSNKFKSIGFKKIIRAEYLNLEHDVKSRGKPKMLKTIMAGFKELQEKEYLRKWNYNEKKDMFTWERTDKPAEPPAELIADKNILENKI